MTKRLPIETRMAQAAAHVTDDGVWLEAIIEALGMGRTHCVEIMTKLCASGGAFRCRVKMDEESSDSRCYALFFKTQTARDDYEAAYKIRLRERARVRQLVHSRAWANRNKDKLAEERKRNRADYVARRAEWRARKKAEKESKAADVKKRAEARAQAAALRLAEAELAKVKRRHEREAAAAEKVRTKAETKKTVKRLKVVTKAAGQIKPQRGTTTPPAAPKPKGPAHIAGELDLSQAKVIKLPGAPESRWDTSGAKSVVDSSACRAWARAAA